MNAMSLSLMSRPKGSHRRRGRQRYTRPRKTRSPRENAMTTQLHDFSIAELSGLVAARKLSPVELTDALIARIERFDAQTRAFITPTFELARRQARAAEAEI